MREKSTAGLFGGPQVDLSGCGGIHVLAARREDR